MTSGVGGGEQAPRVPGLRLLGRLRAGRCGQVWWGIDEGSGDAVSVEVSSAATLAQLDTGGGRAAAAVSRQIAVLRRLQHPHVLALRQVLDLPDGGRAVVSDHADGADLVQLLQARGTLAPGEVTTVVVPIAQALAAIHRGGLTHGELDADAVVFTLGGRPLLAGVGSPVLCGAVAEPAGDPRGDVAGLARLGLRCLGEAATEGGDSRSILAEVLQVYAGGAGRSGDVDDPGGLAMALARSVYAAAPPVPLAMPAPAPVPDATPLPGGSVPSAVPLPSALPPSPVRAPAAAEGGCPPVQSAPTGDEATRVRPQAHHRQEETVLRPGPAPDRPAPGQPQVALSRAPGAGPSPLSGASPSGPSAPPQTPVRAGQQSRPPTPGESLRQSERASAAARQPSRRRPRRGPLLAVVGVVLVTAVAGAIWRDAREGSAAEPRRPAEALTSPTSGTRTATAPAPGPREAVAALADLREAALAAGDESALDAVDVEGSPALAADRALLSQLRQRGERPVGARTRVLDTVLVTWRTGEAVVQVRSRVEAHVLERSDGRPPVSVPEAAPTTLRLVLRPGGPAGWRIWAVEPT